MRLMMRDQHPSTLEIESNVFASIREVACCDPAARAFWVNRNFVASTYARDADRLREDLQRELQLYKSDVLEDLLKIANSRLRSLEGGLHTYACTTRGVCLFSFTFKVAGPHSRFFHGNRAPDSNLF
jgi:hypothetical protein